MLLFSGRSNAQQFDDTDISGCSALTPMSAWLAPNALLVSRDYPGMKGAPEWGVNVSRKNQPLIDIYRFENIVVTL